MPDGQIKKQNLYDITCTVTPSFITVFVLKKTEIKSLRSQLKIVTFNQFCSSAHILVLCIMNLKYQ